MRKLKNYTEEQILQEIEKIVNILAHNFTFGYYDLDDIKQEGRIEGIKALERYDEDLPLANFLCVHIRNRLINIIRNKYHRNDPPCKSCYGSIQGETQHVDGKYCAKFLAWKSRNARKAGLVCPADLSNIDDTSEETTKINSTVSEDFAKQEIWDMIDLKLPSFMRADYLKLKAGISIPKNRRDAVIKKIREFLTMDEIDEIYETADNNED